MGYTITKRVEGVRGGEWVCDAGCDWLPTTELLSIARADVEGEGPGVYDVVQSTVNGVEYHTFTVGSAARGVVCLVRDVRGVRGLALRTERLREPGHAVE